MKLFPGCATEAVFRKIFLACLFTLAVLHISALPAAAALNSERILIFRYPGLTTASEYTALAHAFTAAGLSFADTDVIPASGRGLLVYFPAALEDAYASGLARNIENFVLTGGTLIASGVPGQGFAEFAGIASWDTSRQRFRVDFTREGASYFSFINRPEERYFLTGNRSNKKSLASCGYTVSGGETIALFDDGTAAIWRKEKGEGEIYLIGLSITDLILKPELGLDPGASRIFVNGFEPAADVVKLLLKHIAFRKDGFLITKRAVPHLDRSALLLTFEVEEVNRLKDAEKFFDLCAGESMSATFFVTAKNYGKNGKEEYYIDDDSIGIIKKIFQKGCEIGCHTFTHSWGFFRMPQGSSDMDPLSYDGMGLKTLYGELKTLKKILESQVEGLQIVTFRSGHLGDNDRLSEALEKSGYLYSSNYSAGDLMTCYPVELLSGKTLDSPGGPLIEFPYALDDSAAPLYLREDNLERAAYVFKDIITANAENGTVTVMNIRPDGREYLVSFTGRILDFCAANGIPVRSIEKFGDYYRKRNSVLAGWKKDNGEITITLSEALPGLSFLIEGRRKDKHYRRGRLPRELYRRRQHRIY